MNQESAKHGKSCEYSNIQMYGTDYHSGAYQGSSPKVVPIIAPKPMVTPPIQQNHPGPLKTAYCPHERQPLLSKLKSSLAPAVISHDELEYYQKANNC